ncbi:error-prone DNA polymerase [Kordiimonas sp. SCSIO 12603]|uniref:error-prone DNA polymerase n=1 Tax=Kordiimonas sp. SCSIO 12603 TaxID=2829596 RepID=UPI002102290F|nr:error-prone DNA polymerase [Kordiimonas sp. SCSIO 12603]UTW58831.1 error-prone DNA polymerase [Kordiimonas sp. SCSIO 12603]
MAEYAELQISSNFSFLRGASFPEELIISAKAIGLSAAAITDRNTVAGIVRAHSAAKTHDMTYIPACRLDLVCGLSLLAYPTDKAAYARLTELLTIGNRRAEKGSCYLYLSDVTAFSKGIIFTLLPETVSGALHTELPLIREQLNTNLYLAASYSYQGNDKRRIAWLAYTAAQAHVPLVATGNILFHAPERRQIADIVNCIREHKTIEEAGYLLQQNAERFLKPAHEMDRLFSDHPEALKNTMAIKEACNFSLDELRYNYPKEAVSKDVTPQEHLESLVWSRITERYENGKVPASIKKTLAHELAIVGRKHYAPYFLTVNDIVEYARSREILCQGRGSAANSLICFALRITDVNPEQVDLLFERFISDARSEPPDIDVDFEHERREEVIQYIYKKYGRAHAGLTATLITYRARSAIREVGKVMGLSEDMIGALSGTVWGSYGKEIPDSQVEEAGFDPNDNRLRQTLNLAHEIIGFPRHLSQHVGGFVLTETPLHEIVPIQNAAMQDRTVIEWNKDDLDALEILKVDVLSLGMLTCIRKSFQMIQACHNKFYTLENIPTDDRPTYKMLHKADTIGVFQVESRAQMSMLPRLQPNVFYDLVVQVAIVRPGPIQGDMVHPYLRRRQGLEKRELPKRDPRFGSADELNEVLERTYGVPLFQEQAMRIAIVAAGFTPEEADQLRRSMASFRNQGTIHKFQEKFINGMTSRGYELDFAERCFKQIGGFADYGFPESHAAAFAMLAYASAWLKCHFPHVFACALLNSQPMGFYAPAQIVRDAREHGVKACEVDINISTWDNLLEPAPDNRWGWALRLGFRQIKGISEDSANTITDNRLRPYTDVEDLHMRTRLPVAQIEKLAEADAFRSCGLDRRQALWQVRGLIDSPDLPLFSHADTKDKGVEPETELPTMPLSEHVVNDYQSMRLSLKAHPLSFLRPALEHEGILRCADITKLRDGTKATVAGLVLVRQRPGSAKGVIFLTVEDETGVANVVVWKKVFENQRATVMSSRLLIIKGKLQHESDVTHLVAEELKDASAELLKLSDGLENDADASLQLPAYRSGGHPRNVKDLIPRSRDFH